MNKILYAWLKQITKLAVINGEAKLIAYIASSIVN